MIVCVCNNINAEFIESLIDQKDVKSIMELQKEMNICNQCKTCTSAIQDIIWCADLKKCA